MTDQPTLWAAVPFIDNWADTQQAAEDLIAQQGVDCRVVLINQASSDETRRELDAFVYQAQTRRPGSVLSWTFNPRLPLSAAWNTFLRFVADVEGEDAVGWIVNNDVRLHPQMGGTLVETLRDRDAWFVSGIGVDGSLDDLPPAPEVGDRDFGGPDFSCFVYAIQGWTKHPFDEHFPAYCEDLDLHRRMMLGGDGQRIFGVNAPFVHLASGTLKQGEAHRRLVSEVAAESRRYYREKWGGPENRETFGTPFNQDGVPTVGLEPTSTAELFDAEQARWADTQAE